MTKSPNLLVFPVILAILAFPTMIANGDWTISEPEQWSRHANNAKISSGGMGPVSTPLEVGVWWWSEEHPAMYVRYYTKQGTSTPEGTWSLELGMPADGDPFFGKWVLSWNLVRLEAIGPGGVSNKTIMIFDGTAM